MSTWTRLGLPPLCLPPFWNICGPGCLFLQETELQHFYTTETLSAVYPCEVLQRKCCNQTNCFSFLFSQFTSKMGTGVKEERPSRFAAKYLYLEELVLLIDSVLWMRMCLWGPVPNNTTMESFSLNETKRSWIKEGLEAMERTSDEIVYLEAIQPWRSFRGKTRNVTGKSSIEGFCCKLCTC